MNIAPTEYNVLIENPNPQDKAARRILAINPETNAIILGSLANDEDFYVRRSVAMHHNTSISALAKLSDDNEEGIRFYIAGNPNVTVDILLHLASDDSPDVRAQVAGNPNTTADILENLAKDYYFETRRQVAANINTPEHILTEIGESFVQIAESTALWSNQVAILRAVAMNPKTSVDILEKICSITYPDNHYWLLPATVAQNPNTPASITDLKGLPGFHRKNN
jgi:hypothetical protein